MMRMVYFWCLKSKKVRNKKITQRNRKVKKHEVKHGDEVVLKTAPQNDHISDLDDTRLDIENNLLIS